MIDLNLMKQLVEKVTDQDSLIDLLKTSSDNGGLGWQVDSDLPFQEEPEIADGVEGNGKVTISRFVPRTVDEKRLILLAEFQRPYIRRDLRALLASIRRLSRIKGRFPDHTGLGDTLFIVAAPEYKDVRFVLFEERERRLPRIRSFGWRQEFIGRTVLTHNLERLRWSDRDRWEHAWDVEGLTDVFYAEFVKVFDVVKAATSHPGGEGKKHAYVQQLLDRLLFIAFIERMGWLRTPEGNSDYLHAQWLRFQNRDNYKDVSDKSLIPATFNGLLGWLFFRALDNENGVRLGDRFFPILGEVPYLNGGLFSEEADLDVSGVTVQDEVFDLILGDRRPGFEGGLFRRFNFTVTESTPLDQEVAVDPEMLGKIFERLIIKEERHQTGTYYTPRPIVEFMVNEALKGYLTERGLPADKAALLVDDDKVESDTVNFLPSEMQDTLDWLFEVRAVDPACGSGAYLLMLLQRLFELVDRLEVVRNKKRNPDQKHLYNTKLRLLERCVYGVDRSQIAVRIARLRLWLSLVVENRGEKPEPLPNFDFLIMCGDSLASPVKPDQHTLGYPHDVIREYTRLKRLFFHPQPGQLRPTREEMKAKREEIAAAFESDLANSRLRSLAENPFDWEVEFAEVFDTSDSEETVGGRLNLGAESGRHGQGELAARAARPPGFDIVLANPPYVNSGELLRSAGVEYKTTLITEYRDTGTGTADLLIFFMDRAFQLLCHGGHLSFITSNKWLKATYGSKLRVYLAKTARVMGLIDFRDLPVFQGTIAYPLITIAAKNAPFFGAKRDNVRSDNVNTRFVSVPSLAAPYPDVLALVATSGVDLPNGLLGTDGNWQLETGDAAYRLAKMREHGIPLSKYVKGRIYYGVKTGLNEVKIGSDGRMYGKNVPQGVRVIRKEGVFVIDGAKRAELIAEDPNSAEIIKPLAIGRDIRRWVVKENDRWLIVVKIGTDINRYPAIKRHLGRYKDMLIPRADQGEYWWELRACAYYDLFEGPKIIYQEIADRPSIAMLPPSWYINNKAYMIPGEDLFLMAAMNSSPAETWLRQAGTAGIGGAVNMQTNMVGRLPIPAASTADRAKLSDVVQRILDCKATNPGHDVSDLEAEIDRRFEFLYFHADEAPTYDEWIAKREAEKGTVTEEVRRLIAIGHETDSHEYKSSFAWDMRKNERGDFLKDEVHTAICAFLNAGGGEVLIGVDDDGNILGLEKDLSRYGSKDKLVQAIETPFGKMLAPNPIDLIKIGFVEIDGKTICRVRVQGDNSVIYRFKDGIYVRRNSGSKPALTAEEAAYWWRRRQRGEA
jgi:hypothetical protein